MRFRALLSMLAMAAGDTIIDNQPAFSQSNASLQVAQLDFQQPPLTPHFSNQRVRIPLSPQSISQLRARGVRVRAIRGLREWLERLPVGPDGCVTIPAYSYQVSVSGTAVQFHVNNAWLQRDRNGAASESAYLLVFEFGGHDDGHLRVKRTDLLRYLSAGFPIVVAPPGSYTRAQLIALGQQIGAGTTPVVVQTCYAVASLPEGRLELIASSCKDDGSASLEAS